MKVILFLIIGACSSCSCCFCRCCRCCCCCCCCCCWFLRLRTAIALDEDRPPLGVQPHLAPKESTDVCSIGCKPTHTIHVWHVWHIYGIFHDMSLHLVIYFMGICHMLVNIPYTWMGNISLANLKGFILGPTGFFNSATPLPWHPPLLPSPASVSRLMERCF